MSGFKVNFSVNNQLSTPSIHAAPFAQRPAAGQPGRVFIDSDNPSTGIYRDTGTTWVAIGNPSSPDVDTLQIVTDRGNTTTNSITVGAATTPSGTVDVRRSTAALNGTNDWAFLGVNTPTIPSGASFGVNYVNAVYGSQAQTFAGNATIGNTGLNSAGNFINTLGNSASGTITVAQGSGTIRAIAGLHAGIYYNTPNAMTFTHVAGIRTLQPINSGAVGASVTNYYGVQIADSTPSSGTISYTNRYGIYQEGASDVNYFAGNIGIGNVGSGITSANNPLIAVKNQNASTWLRVENNTNGNLALAGVFFKGDTGASTNLSKLATNYTSYKGSGPNDISLYNDTSGDINFLNDWSGGKIKFNTGGGSTPIMTIHPSGNITVGGTVDGGVKFWVTGYTQINGLLNVTGGGSYINANLAYLSSLGSNLISAATNAVDLKFQTAPQYNQYIRFVNDVNSMAAGNYVQMYNGYTFTNIGTGTINVLQINPTINQTTGTGNIYGFRFNPTNTAVLSTVWAFYADSGRGYLNDVLSIGTTTPNAASLLQIDSTTKGFLPPRMTDAQITAITTPPNGLFVYSTDQNCPAFYDGTGWRKISHSAL